MSVVLIVTKDKKQIAKAPLTAGVFVIGRSDKCNLCVDEELASRQHTEIFREGSRYCVRDKGSRNGTFLNGEKLTGPHDLKDGDEIEIGSTRIKFLSEEEKEDEEAGTVASLPQDALREAGQVVVEKKVKGNLEVKLRVADGPLAGGLFKNWEGALTIGRAKENNVMLVDDAVSSFHAKIVQDGDSYFIEDTDSANGTFLNGVKIQRTQLAGGNKIKVGASTLIFEITDLRVQRRNLNIVLMCVILSAVAFVAVKFWPDPAGAHILAGRRLEKNGEYTHALEEFHQAALLKPNRAEATEGYSRVKSEIDASGMLVQAEKAAAEENYDKALDLVFRVERTFKSSPRAKELEAVIKSIQEAKIALDHQNWEIAVKLLEKALEAYPSSQLISLQLGQAKKELLAQQNLSQAKEAFQYEQWDKARQLLAMVPSASVYANEAKEYTDKIGRQEQISQALGSAKAFYSQGQLIPALGEIDKGLKISADSPTLLDLQNRIRTMVPLAGPLKKAQSLGQDSSIDELLAARKSSAEVLQTENDPLNSMVKSAKDVDAHVLQWLQTISQTDTDNAQGLLKSGNPTGALSLFTQAVKANPKNQTAVEQATRLQKEIVGQCMELYGMAMRYKELGLTDKVRENLKRVLELDLPDDRWYKLATEELARLK